MNLYLSEAIKKRQQLLEKARAMENWALDQKIKSKQLIWPEMEKAIKQVIDQAYDEWQKYDDSIEKDINQLQLEIK